LSNQGAPLFTAGFQADDFGGLVLFFGQEYCLYFRYFRHRIFLLNAGARHLDTPFLFSGGKIIKTNQSSGISRSVYSTVYSIRRT
jgi:hypothetical protein